MKGKEHTSHWIHIFPHQPLHCHSHLLKKQLSIIKQTLNYTNKRLQTPSLLLYYDAFLSETGYSEKKNVTGLDFIDLDKT